MCDRFPFPSARVVLSVILCAAPTTAQAVARPPRAAGPAFKLNARPGLHMLDGRLTGGADDYKVSFDAAGFAFTPALGTAAPRDVPLCCSLLAIGRGATAAPLALATPSWRGLRVEFDRGVAIERYDVGIDGMELSFVFATRPPGTGDLVVRARLATAMTVTPHDGGLRLESPGIGGFDIGRVAGVDARGWRVDGNVRYEAGVLELSLPSDFVDHAALPFTLDPPVGNVFRVTNPTALDDDKAPYVSYDLGTDSYLVIWTRRFSSTDFDVHGQRISRAGALLGTRVFIENSNALESEPQVANVHARNAFVVVYTRDGDIIGRTVNAATGQVSASVVIAGGPSVQHSGSVGGDSGSRTQALCVWQSDTDQAMQATAVTVDPALQLLVPGPVRTLTGLGQTANRPRVSRNGGAAGRHAIAWQRDDILNHEAHVLVVDSTGLPVTGDTRLDPFTSAPRQRPEVDGDGTSFVVAWQEEISSTNHHVVATRVQFVPGQASLVNLSGFVVLAGTSLDEAEPTVTWLGESAVIGWTEKLSTTTAHSRVRSIDPFSCRACEGTFSPVGPFSVDLAPGGCGTVAGGGPAGDALLAWESENPGNAFNGDIVAQLFTAADGTVTSLGGGCGRGGAASASCARVPNPSFAHELAGASPHTATILLLSPGQSTIGCGPCAVIPDVGAPIITFSSTGGTGDTFVVMGIPADPSLRGAAIVEQWFTFNSGAACPQLGLDMSNALRIRFE